MHLILACFAGFVFLAMLGALIRVVRGPTLWDRLTGLLPIATKTLILLLVAGELIGEPEMFVDLALTYALIGFLGILIFAKYFDRAGA